MVEDLIDNTTTALNEVMRCKESYANVIGLVSLFDYGLGEITAQYEKKKCPVYSVINFDSLLSVIIKERLCKSDKIALLQEWKENPAEWSRKNVGEHAEIGIS
jgi:orotate phosphoribosyltransferase